MMRHLLTAGLILSIAAVGRAEEPLSVGDPAPKLKVKEFVKGQPVKSLAKGKVYVVEFWATWCGPCRATIPHLTELAKEHKAVTFIGVSIAEPDFSKVKPFVEEMGDKMAYRVAIDAVPEGKKADDGAMVRVWMNAADRHSIPCAFIVDADGMIAWIGSPTNMDKPLDLIAAGKWDLKAEATRIKKRRDLDRTLARHVRTGEGSDAFPAVDAFLKDYPAASDSIALTLNDLAWNVVDPKRVKANPPPPKQRHAAVAAAAKAVELTQEKKANMLDTLAQAHFVDGDVAAAIEVQKLAVKLRPKDQELQEHLDALKKAKEKDDK